MCGISREKNRELKEKGIMNIIGRRYIWLYSSENLLRDTGRSITNSKRLIS